MKIVLSYLSMIRPGNVLMTGTAVALGAWLSHGFSDIRAVTLLAACAMSAVGYGNVINDIRDIATDRISHPHRALPRGLVSMEAAIIFAFFLFSFATVNAFMVSRVHGIGAVAALALLTGYAFFLKATPFAGNILVSLLVAYPLVFGGLTAPLMARLLIPASLAFLLNMAREIIKDIQDEQGDRLAGLTTTAILPKNILKGILIAIAIIYAGLLFLPFGLRQFGIVYALICACIALPIHAFWTALIARKPTNQNELKQSLKDGDTGKNTAVFTDKQLSSVSFLIKIEMLAGLAAMAADQLFSK